MPKVEIRKHAVWVGSKRIPLVSAEVHYWRVPPAAWSENLKRVREAGIEIISTYVPWNHHEYRKGKFDFTGAAGGTRNLKRFLTLTRDQKFWMVIRPGPYIYSEWPNDGVPDDVYSHHRLHPRFLAAAGEYLKQVARVLRPFLATRKRGHILLLQADNEIDPWPDRHGVQYGLGGKPGMFQDFLKELYRGDLGELNEKWGTDYSSFDEAAPFIAPMPKNERGIALKGAKELGRNLDYFRFKHHYSLQCARWNVSAFRSLGINVPIYLNLYPFFYAHDWHRMQSAADMVGVDLYPSSEFSEDSFELRKFIDKVRYLGNVSRLPFIAEFGAGVWHGRHLESGIFTPNHYRLAALGALLGGVKGWNWYMFVNRDNWYQSPVDEWGRARPEFFSVFRKLVKVFRRMDPPSLVKRCEAGVTFHPLHRAARTFRDDDPVLEALSKGDIDYHLYDLRSPLPACPVLFYSGNQWLEREAHRHLRRYVEEGGTLVSFRDFPRQDENFEPCSLTGFEEPSRILFEFPCPFAVQFAAGRPTISIITSSVFCFDPSPGKRIETILGSYGRRTVGYIKQMGRGQLIHLGFEPTGELMLELLRFLRIPLYAHSATQGIATALFERGRTSYLIAVNNGREEKSALLQLPHFRGQGKYHVHDLFSDERRAVSFGREPKFSVNLPAKDGRVFEIRKV